MSDLSEHCKSVVRELACAPSQPYVFLWHSKWRLLNLRELQRCLEDLHGLEEPFESCRKVVLSLRLVVEDGEDVYVTDRSLLRKKYDVDLLELQESLKEESS